MQKAYLCADVILSSNQIWFQIILLCYNWFCPRTNLATNHLVRQISYYAKEVCVSSINFSKLFLLSIYFRVNLAQAQNRFHFQTYGSIEPLRRIFTQLKAYLGHKNFRGQ